MLSVFDKYLQWPCVNIYIYIYILQQDKCKIFGCVSVNDLHLHWTYTLYIRLLTFTSTALVRTLDLYMWTKKLLLLIGLGGSI
jgi:hypothetical protein